MEYRVEIFDRAGCRVKTYDEVPLLEASRSTPDQSDRIEGILPDLPESFGPGYRVRVVAGNRPFCAATVVRVEPSWGDTRRLILDRYVSFHEMLAFEAEARFDTLNPFVAANYRNAAIGDIVRDLINRARGPIHYRVAHTAYPDGAQREFAKFEARKTPENELGPGGIAEGQWVGGARIDATGAYAKDGDTIAGLVVDGMPWPDLRLMMIDAEEKSLNSHAESRHPEVADWSGARYAASGYRLRADAARDALQDLIDTRGVGFIELNPHRDSSGAFDDRVDAYGRYLGLVYGGGECFNAALVERGLADVYLYDEGNSLEPSLQLKDFFSYTRINAESVDAAGEVLESFDFGGNILEGMTSLAYSAGCAWTLEPDGALVFRRLLRPDRVVTYDPRRMAVSLGSDIEATFNVIYYEGSPIVGSPSKTYRRSDSADEYGARTRHLDYYASSHLSDVDRLVTGLLDDLAYPVPVGHATWFEGDADIAVGDILEIRGAPVRRLDRELPGEWGGRFAGRLVGRVKRVRHRLSGRTVTTTAELTSPLRSIDNPITYVVRSQPSPATLYEFRLDDEMVTLDAGFHLD